MKRAIAITELTLILLALAAGIGLILFAKQGTQKVSCLEDVTLCKQSYSFFQRIKQKIPVGPRVDCVAISPPNCDEKDLKTTDKQQTMHVIAENLRYCWDKTLGKDNTIGQDFAEWSYIWRAIHEPDVDFCLVCSEFTPAVSISASEWSSYLASQTVPGSSTTYDQFLQPFGPEIFAKRYKDISFTAGTRYYVVDVSAEQSKGDKQNFLYIDPTISCGDSSWQQIHYQLQPLQ